MCFSAGNKYQRPASRDMDNQISSQSKLQHWWTSCRMIQSRTSVAHKLSVAIVFDKNNIRHNSDVIWASWRLSHRQLDYLFNSLFWLITNKRQIAAFLLQVNTPMTSGLWKEFRCNDFMIIRRQAPVPLKVIRSNSKFDQILECSSLRYASPIATKSCTRHDSVTVVTSAKFRCDRLSAC